MMNDEIDVSGHDLTETLAKARRRRAETEQAAAMSEFAALMLPLSLALARLAARNDVRAVGA